MAKYNSYDSLPSKAKSVVKETVDSGLRNGKNNDYWVRVENSYVTVYEKTDDGKTEIASFPKETV